MASKRINRYKGENKNRNRRIESRNVLSYDDLPIEDYEVEVEDSKAIIYRKILNVIFILFLCSLGIIFILNIRNFSPSNIGDFISSKILRTSQGNGYPFNMACTSVDNNNFRVIDKDVVMVTDTSFIVLNNTGREIANRQHSFSNPILKSDLNKFLIYDLGSNEIQIETKSKTLHKETIDNNIMAGAISQSGVYALITECNGYFNEMIVYSKDNNAKYKYYFSESYITDICLSGDGKYAAVSGVCANNGGIKSIVYVFDFNLDKPLYTFEYDDNIMTHIEYLSNGNVVAVGDSLTTFINVTKGSKKDFSYDNNVLTCLKIDKDSGVALCLSPMSDCKESNVIIFDKQGKALSNIKLEMKVRLISYVNNRILMLSSNTLYEYNFKGNKKYECTVGNDVKQIDLLSNNIAYMLYTNSVDKIELR